MDNSFGKYCKKKIKIQQIMLWLLIILVHTLQTRSLSSYADSWVLCSQPFESQMGLKLQNRCLDVKLFVSLQFVAKISKSEFQAATIWVFSWTMTSFLTADGMTVHLSVNVVISACISLSIAQNGVPRTLYLLV